MKGDGTATEMLSMVLLFRQKEWRSVPSYYADSFAATPEWWRHIVIATNSLPDVELGLLLILAPCCHVGLTRKQFHQYPLSHRALKAVSDVGCLIGGQRHRATKALKSATE